MYIVSLCGETLNVSFLLGLRAMTNYVTCSHPHVMSNHGGYPFYLTVFSDITQPLHFCPSLIFLGSVLDTIILL